MSKQLERIIAEGTRDARYKTTGKPSNHIVCTDGFTMSVIAGGGAYSSPSQSGAGYDAVEIGYPSVRPEPWSQWAEYAEQPDDATGTVYGRVPVALVRALVETHGGTA